MSLLSGSVSITRYQVQGKLEKPILETIADGLQKNTISEIDDPAILRNTDSDLTSLEIGNRIVLEKRDKKAIERISIKGENAGLEEAMLALQKGALVAELNLVYRSAEQKWQFTIKGESLNLSSVKTPKIAAPESAEDMQSVVLEKIFLYDKILQFLEKLYKTFIKNRLSDHWQKRDLPLIKKWSRSRA